MKKSINPQAKLQELEARKAHLFTIKAKPSEIKSHFVALKQRLAQAMADGNEADIAATNRGISEAAQNELRAIEQAEIASHAIKLVDEQIAEVMREIDKEKQTQLIAGVETFEAKNKAAKEHKQQIHEKLFAVQREADEADAAHRQLVRDNLDGRYFAALKHYDEVLMFELNEAISSAALSTSANSFDGVTMRQNTPNKASANDALFKKIESTLQPAAAIAEVQATFLKIETNKRELLNRLNLLGAKIKAAVLNSDFVVPELFFAAESKCWSSWTSDDQLEPVIEFLRESGVPVAA